MLHARQLRRGGALVAALLAMATPAALDAAPFLEAFTYQGRLDDGGVPADGVYDFELTLLDAESGGVVISGPGVAEDVTVENGLFSLPVFFPPAAYSEFSYWLQISVRPGGETGAFTPVGPPTRILPVPVAIESRRARALRIPGAAISGVALADGSTPDSPILEGGGDEGAFTVRTPDVSSSNVDAADLTIETGEANIIDSSASGGDLLLRTGRGSSSTFGGGDGGDIILETGEGRGGDGAAGDVIVRGGTASSGLGGDLVVETEGLFEQPVQMLSSLNLMDRLDFGNFDLFADGFNGVIMTEEDLVLDVSTNEYRFSGGTADQWTTLAVTPRSNDLTNDRFEIVGAGSGTDVHVIAGDTANTGREGGEVRLDAGDGDGPGGDVVFVAGQSRGGDEPGEVRSESNFTAAADAEVDGQLTVLGEGPGFSVDVLGSLNVSDSTGLRSLALLTGSSTVSLRGRPNDASDFVIFSDGVAAGMRIEADNGAGSAGTDAHGGDIDVSAGIASTNFGSGSNGIGGDIALTAGRGGGDGGAVTISGGDGGAFNPGRGGDIVLEPGEGTGSDSDGEVEVRSDLDVTGAISGASLSALSLSVAGVDLTPGPIVTSDSLATNIDGHSIFMHSPPATSRTLRMAVTPDGGEEAPDYFELVGGNNATNLRFIAGDGGSGTSEESGGSVSLAGGEARGSGTGGGVILTGGDGSPLSTSEGGGIFLTGGMGSESGGDIVLTGGEGGGVAGSIRLVAGEADGTFSSDGDITLTVVGSGDIELFGGQVFTDDRLAVNRAGSPGFPLHVGTSGSSDGNGAHVTNAGVWTNGSSRTFKEGFEEVDPREILARLVALPVTRWTYKDNDEGEHIGPVAEDFREAFGLGHSDRYIATVDADGVALAAIQGLHAEIEERDARIAELEQRLARLETLLMEQ